MARSRIRDRRPSAPSVRARRGVTLPLAPWEVAPHLARPDLEHVEGPAELAVDARGEAKVIRPRVWRVPESPVMRALPEGPRAALATYADLVERVAASGGTADPTGGGGGGRPASGPSLARLAAARRLASLDAALAGHRFVALRLRSGSAVTVTPYRDLVVWVAVDGASRAEIEARCGIPRSDAWRARLTAAIGDAAHLLALRLGVARRDADTT